MPAVRHAAHASGDDKSITRIRMEIDRGTAMCTLVVFETAIRTDCLRRGSLTHAGHRSERVMPQPPDVLQKTLLERVKGKQRRGGTNQHTLTKIPCNQPASTAQPPGVPWGKYATAQWPGLAARSGSWISRTQKSPREILWTQPTGRACLELRNLVKKSTASRPSAAKGVPAFVSWLSSKTGMHLCR